MKNLYGSFAAKLIAVILLCVMVLIFTGCAMASAEIFSRGGYSGSFENMRESYISYLGDRMLSQVGNAYLDWQLT